MNCFPEYDVRILRVDIQIKGERPENGIQKFDQILKVRQIFGDGHERDDEFSADLPHDDMP